MSVNIFLRTFNGFSEIFCNIFREETDDLSVTRSHFFSDGFHIQRQFWNVKYQDKKVIFAVLHGQIIIWILKCLVKQQNCPAKCYLPCNRPGSNALVLRWKLACREYQARDGFTTVQWIGKNNIFLEHTVLIYNNLKLSLVQLAN